MCSLLKKIKEPAVNNAYNIKSVIFCEKIELIMCIVLYKSFAQANKDDFNQQTACKAPNCWLKYTT